MNFFLQSEPYSAEGACRFWARDIERFLIADRLSALDEKIERSRAIIWRRKLVEDWLNFWVDRERTHLARLSSSVALSFV